MRIVLELPGCILEHVMDFFGLKRFLIAALLLPLLVASGCRSNTENHQQNQNTGSPAKQLRVIATFLPIYLFTKAVAGNAAKVDILIKPGTEVHEYQSKPADIQTIAQADVVVKNGLGIEEFLAGTIKSAENSKLKIVDASQGIPAVAENPPVVSASGSSTSNQPRETSHHEHENGNPHVWLDPVLAKKQVENIRDGLATADPVNKATYQANAAAYIKQLNDLNTQFEQGLQGFRDRTFITFHNAFSYLAKRYQLKQLAVVELPEDQLSPGDVQRAVGAVKQYKVKALFSEPGIDNKLLSSLSQDLNLTLRPLDSLEAGQTDPQYYFTAMEANLQTLEAAFK